MDNSLKKMTRSDIKAIDRGAAVYFTDRRGRPIVSVVPGLGFKACDRYAILTVIEQYQRLALAQRKN
jgi:hypothetical protein